VAGFLYLCATSTREPTSVLKEYGSNVQKMVRYIVALDDREQRTRYAHILVELMRQIHPAMRDGQDYSNKLWDDLYILSGFQLDVDSPYPPPSPESLGKAPQRVPYNTHPTLRYKHFGHNIDLLVAKAAALTDADERRAFVSYLVRLMRSFYTIWNKENVEDETIYQSLLDISKSELYDDIQLIRAEGLIESNPRERGNDQPQKLNNPRQPSGGSSQPNGFRQNNGPRRDNNNPRNGGNGPRREGNGNNPGNNNSRNRTGPFRAGGNNGGANPGNPNPGNGNRPSNNGPRRRR
jgi:hypothetical protein